MAEAFTPEQLEQFSPRELLTLRAMELGEPNVSPEDLLSLRARLLETEQSRGDQQPVELETPAFTPLPEAIPTQEVEELGPYAPRGRDDRWRIHDWAREAPIIGPVIEGVVESGHLAKIGAQEVMPGVPDLEERRKLLQERDVPPEERDIPGTFGRAVGSTLPYIGLCVAAIPVGAGLVKSINLP